MHKHVVVLGHGQVVHKGQVDALEGLGAIGDAGSRLIQLERY